MRIFLTLSKLAMSRLAVFISALFYAYVIHYAHTEYLNPIWEYYGFTYRPVDIYDIFFITCLILCGSIFLPLKLERPSSIILLLLFLIVYIPSIVITMGLNAERISVYGGILVALGFGFSLICYITKINCKRQQFNELIFPGKRFIAAFLLAWLLFCVVLISTNYSIMRISALDEIYFQRELGASQSLLMGYIQTYFTSIINPTLIALGLKKNQWILVVIGAIGCLIMYMITAEKSTFMLPFIIITLYLFLNKNILILKSNVFFINIFSLIALYAVTNYQESNTANFISLYFVFRTLSLPGLCFSQYFDLFNTYGFTFWSHVKGLDFIISTPYSYANDPLWPNLGHMIGDRIYSNSENNANANLFSGDGVAAAGSFGIVVISIVFSIWLYFFDLLSRKWSENFVLLVTVPLALKLNNGHFFTTMLSFGGFFWIIVFYLYKSSK